MTTLTSDSDNNASAMKKLARGNYLFWLHVGLMPVGYSWLLSTMPKSNSDA